MWLTVSRPSSIDEDAIVVLARVHARPGQELKIGDILLDLTVELGSSATRDCPAVSTCRIALQERAWLREVKTEIGAHVTTEILMALLSTNPDEAPAPPSRAARTAAMAVLMHADWWLSEP